MAIQHLEYHQVASDDQLIGAIRQLAAAIQARFQHEDDRTGHDGGQLAPENTSLHIEQLLAGLSLDGHDEAERRMNRLFVRRARCEQRVVVEALIHEATTTSDHVTLLLACSLLEAADRLDPTLITVDEVESLTVSTDRSLRSCAAVLMWQWAQSLPGRVPVPLLARLALPGEEDWYVHAPARAGAQTLLIHRAAARAIFDQMAASRDPEDRSYAASDLLDVARVEPRAIPKDLARKLARDHDEGVAARGSALVREIRCLGEDENRFYYMPFGL